jgi:hypothetical protein
LTSKLEIEKGRYFQINRTEGFCKICNDSAPPTAGNPLVAPSMTLAAISNASVCPVKKLPALPARINIYFCK